MSFCLDYYAHGKMRRNVAYGGRNVPPELRFKHHRYGCYDLMQLGEHEYVLPVTAEVLARIAKRRLVRNEITFRVLSQLWRRNSATFRMVRKHELLEAMELVSRCRPQRNRPLPV
jgi:hypothetical protein